MFDLSPPQLALCFAPALINLWAIWHAGTHVFATRTEQALWVCAGVFLPVLGGVAYVCLGLRRSRKADLLRR
jgi:hypothetical protein